MAVTTKLLADNLGTLTVMAIAALSAGALKTYSTSNANATEIHTMRKDHEKASQNRYTSLDASARETDVNMQLRDLNSRLSELEGRHIGHKPHDSQ